MSETNRSKNVGRHVFVVQTVTEISFVLERNSDKLPRTNKPRRVIQIRATSKGSVPSQEGDLKGFKRNVK